MLTGTLEAAKIHPVPTELVRGFLRKKTLIESEVGGFPSPHAYLIEQSPDSVGPSHFHQNAEFQIIVAGDGLFGRRPVKPYMVHYAGQQTGYGPLTAGPNGLSYLTLRPVTDFGIWMLPESRNLMDPRIPRGQVHSEVLPGRASGLGGQVVSGVIAPRADGLASWRVQLPVEGKAVLPAHPGGGGAFLVVIGGAMIVAGKAFGTLGTVWVGTAEPAPDIHAGPEGVDFLVMQFPGNAWAFTEQPVRKAQ